MEAGRWGEKKTLHHANDLAPGSFSFCQESPFQFEWIWIKRISHKGQVWPKQHFVCKSTGSKRSVLFLPLSCSHYQRPTCQRQLSVKVDDDQPTLRTTTASTPVISAARFTSPPADKTSTFHHISLFAEKEPFLFSTTSTYLRGSWDKLIGETRGLARWMITRLYQPRSHSVPWLLLRAAGKRLSSTNEDKILKERTQSQWRANSISCMKCPLNWICTC